MQTLYKHKNCEDTAIQIDKKYYIPEKRGWKLKINWWFRSALGGFYPAGHKDKVFISKEDWKNWEIVK